jgi:hypothetical protein
MRNSVFRESAAEEIRYKPKPMHDADPLITR